MVSQRSTLSPHSTKALSSPSKLGEDASSFAPTFLPRFKYTQDCKVCTCKCKREPVYVCFYLSTLLWSCDMSDLLPAFATAKWDGLQPRCSPARVKHWPIMEDWWIKPLHLLLKKIFVKVWAKVQWREKLLLEQTAAHWSMHCLMQSVPRSTTVASSASTAMKFSALQCYEAPY